MDSPWKKYWRILIRWHKLELGLKQTWPPSIGYLQKYFQTPSLKLKKGNERDGNLSS
ncbi:hypothetical protein LguiB_023890 [Lonicera macranthoides]